MSDPRNDEDDADAANRVHVALFSHVGVTDPADWHSVALRLADRYAPTVLVAPVRKKSGRPRTTDELSEVILLHAVEAMQDAWRSGLIKTNLSTIGAVCHFFLKDARATEIRDHYKMYIPLNISVAAMRNAVSKARNSQAASQKLR